MLDQKTLINRNEAAKILDCSINLINHLIKEEHLEWADKPDQRLQHLKREDVVNYKKKVDEFRAGIKHIYKSVFKNGI